MRRVISQYYGMVSHADEQLGRVWAALEDFGVWDDTMVVLASDHGEQLGDQGLMGKLGFFEASYHIPCVVRDPRHPEGHGRIVDRFTENVDILPTLCDALGLPVPAQCDGLPLTPFLAGDPPPWWRTEAHWEFDWRIKSIVRHAGVDTVNGRAWPWHRSWERQNLAAIRSHGAAYVQFGDGTWLAFDLAGDPTWATPLTDPVQVLDLAASMLAWRAEHADRTMTGFVLADGGIGRRP